LGLRKALEAGKRCAEYAAPVGFGYQADAEIIDDALATLAGQPKAGEAHDNTEKQRTRRSARAFGRRLGLIHLRHWASFRTAAAPAKSLAKVEIINQS
jgi:hypothetical protein